jgi:hypothetical protein
LKLIASLISIAGCALAACGAQATPQRPSGSAAALAEPEAERASVVRALREDPPLPGNSVEGWEGLQPPAAASGDAAGHQHHEPHHHQHGKAQP